MLLIRQVSMSLIDVSFKDLSPPEIMDIDQLPGCSTGKVVKKESAESDSDHSKRKKNSSKVATAFVTEVTLISFIESFKKIKSEDILSYFQLTDSPS